MCSWIGHWEVSANSASSYGSSKMPLLSLMQNIDTIDMQSLIMGIIPQVYLQGHQPPEASFHGPWSSPQQLLKSAACLVWGCSPHNACHGGCCLSLSQVSPSFKQLMPAVLLIRSFHKPLCVVRSGWNHRWTGWKDHKHLISWALVQAIGTVKCPSRVSSTSPLGYGQTSQMDWGKDMVGRRLCLSAATVFRGVADCT